MEKKRRRAHVAMHIAMRTELDERRNYTMERIPLVLWTHDHGRMWGVLDVEVERVGRGLCGVRQSHHNLLLISWRVYDPVISRAGEQLTLGFHCL